MGRQNDSGAPRCRTLLDGLRWEEVPSHRRRLRTTNGIEHDHAEMRRRTRVVRIFPNETSLLRLSSALAAERNEQWMERRCARMDLEQEQQLRLTA